MNAEDPAVANISTSTGALNPPPDAATLASPFESVTAMLCVTFKITGIPGFPGFVSPLPTPGTNPPPRNTVVRKFTGAPITLCGAAAESTTRTTTGWNACPVETCPPPATGCSTCCDNGTGFT